MRVAHPSARAYRALCHVSLCVRLRPPPARPRRRRVHGLRHRDRDGPAHARARSAASAADRDTEHRVGIAPRPGLRLHTCDATSRSDRRAPRRGVNAKNGTQLCEMREDGVYALALGLWLTVIHSRLMLLWLCALQCAQTVHTQPSRHTVAHTPSPTRDTASSPGRTRIVLYRVPYIVS